jgi:hypothetical protein
MPPLVLPRKHCPFPNNGSSETDSFALSTEIASPCFEDPELPR